MAKFMQKTDHSLTKLRENVESEITSLSNMILQQLDDNRRKKLSSLIICRVHHRDILDNMIDQGPEQATDFLFKVQLKFDLKTNAGHRGGNFSRAIEDYVNNVEFER